MQNGLSTQLNIRQQQRLQLNPQLLQSMNVLCMNNTELTAHIDRLYAENPCIEKSEQAVPDAILNIVGHYRSVLNASQGVGTSGRRNRSVHDGDDNATYNSNELSRRFVDEHLESLSYNLRSQVERRGLDKSLSAVCIYLIDNIDEKGRLPLEEIEAAREIGVPDELIEEAVRVIKSLEPAGVGAADIAEFIRLQLERYYPDEKLALALTEMQYMEALARHQYRHLADMISADVRLVREAAELISSLNTDISIGYSEVSENVFISPDIYVYMDENQKLHAVINEFDVPVVGVSEKYIEIYKTTDDKELKAYLREKINQTYQLINSIERRESTLKRCFNLIMTRQSEFFTGESTTIRPLTMAMAAEELEVNVSTVSRCIMNKYVQCGAGVFPIKYFFSKSLTPEGGPERSAQGAKLEIASMIAAEDGRKPLSDSRLCSLLEEKGYVLKRRTVAKYREEMNIPEYRLRRK